MFFIIIFCVSALALQHLTHRQSSYTALNLLFKEVNVFDLGRVIFQSLFYRRILFWLAGAIVVWMVAHPLIKDLELVVDCL